ncbi:hypothetical protein QUF58_03055 [Anaerolineales bacterium HSG24]|nr:hypothetical protein [Anaerolineales bacterium HSG24]
MTFDELYKACLITGTSYKDRRTGVGISLKPKSGEKIRLFPLDNPPNRECRLREHLRLKQVCDLVLFYSDGRRLIICLVELKGSDIYHAAEQLINVYRKLQPYLRRVLPTSTVGEKIHLTEWRAYICQGKHSSAHSQRRKKTRLLLQKFGQFNRYDISRNPDVGQFLRKK